MEGEAFKMKPQYTVAIVLEVYAETALEARDRVMPYVHDMRVRVEAIEVTPRAGGATIGFPIARS